MGLITSKYGSHDQVIIVYMVHVGKYLRYTGPPQCMSVNFTKGNNFWDFLLASLDDISLPKYSQRTAFASNKANVFLLEHTPPKQEAKIKMAELLPLEVFSSALTPLHSERLKLYGVQKGYSKQDNIT